VLESKRCFTSEELQALATQFKLASGKNQIVHGSDYVHGILGLTEF
jgi:hypothetical protein